MKNVFKTAFAAFFLMICTGAGPISNGFDWNHIWALLGGNGGALGRQNEFGPELNEGNGWHINASTSVSDSRHAYSLCFTNSPVPGIHSPAGTRMFVVRSDNDRSVQINEHDAEGKVIKRFQLGWVLNGSAEIAPRTVQAGSIRYNPVNNSLVIFGNVQSKALAWEITLPDFPGPAPVDIAVIPHLLPTLLETYELGSCGDDPLFGDIGPDGTGFTYTFETAGGHADHEGNVISFSTEGGRVPGGMTNKYDILIHGSNMKQTLPEYLGIAGIAYRSHSGQRPPRLIVLPSLEVAVAGLEFDLISKDSHGDLKYIGPTPFAGRKLLQARRNPFTAAVYIAPSWGVPHSGIIYTDNQAVATVGKSRIVDMATPAPELAVKSDIASQIHLLWTMAGDGKLPDAIKMTEHTLAELKNEKPGPQTSTEKDDSIIALYSFLAWARRTSGDSKEAVRSIYYSAMTQAPDSLGTYPAVRELAETYDGPDRDNLLINLSCQYANHMLGRAAAHFWLRNQLKTRGDTSTEILLDLAMRGVGGELIANEICRTLLDSFNKDEDLHSMMRRLCLAQATLCNSEYSSGIISAYVEWLLLRDSAAQARIIMGSLNRYVPLKYLKNVVARLRLKENDALGSFSVLNECKFDRQNSSFIQQLIEMNKNGNISDLTIVADKAMATVEDSASSNKLSIDDFYYKIVKISEDANVYQAAISVYNLLIKSHGKLPISVFDGRILAQDFGVTSASPRDLMLFWKAHALLAQNDPAAAARILLQLSNSAAKELRAQASFDLAKLDQLRGHYEDARQRLENCKKDIPDATFVSEHLINLTKEGRAREQKELYYRELAQQEQVAGETTDRDAAAAALLRAAQLEQELNSPSRAADILERLMAQYPRVSIIPQVIIRLADIYQQNLNEPEKSQLLRDRLHREFPQTERNEKTPSSGSAEQAQ